MSFETIFFENQTTNGTSGSHNFSTDKIQIQVSGTPDGASIQPQVSNDGVTFTDLDGITYTIADVNKLDLAAGTWIRFMLSSAGASTDLTVTAAPYGTR